MSEQITIQDLNKFPPNTPVGNFIGTVAAVFNQRTGTNGKGDWALQTIKLRQGEDEIAVLLKDRPPFPFQKGQDVRIDYYAGDRGPTGAVTYDDDFNGTISRQIKVTPTGQISLLSGGAPEQNQQRETAAPTQARQESAPAAQNQQRNTTTTQPIGDAEAAMIKETKKAIVQIANLHLLCALVVERVEAPAFHTATGVLMSEGQKQAAIASIFIKAERSGLVNEMPKRPLENA
jgi:hypothetical protein